MLRNCIRFSRIIILIAAVSSYLFLTVGDAHAQYRSLETANETSNTLMYLALGIAAVGIIMAIVLSSSDAPVPQIDTTDVDSLELSDLRSLHKGEFLIHHDSLLSASHGQNPAVGELPVQFALGSRRNAYGPEGHTMFVRLSVAF